MTRAAERDAGRQQHRHVRRADGRAVELRAAAGAGTAGHRRHLRRRDRVHRQSFPDTNSQFGSGGPYSDGIVNGPLTAYSDGSGTRPSPFSTDQGVFSVAGSDPTASMPIYGSGSSNFWMDLQVDITPPTGTSYRLWPNYPTIPGHINSDTVRLHAGNGVPAVGVLQAGQHLVLQPARCGGAADQVRDLERRYAERWSRAPTTRRPPGRERPGPAGSPARTAASRFPREITRWRCSTAAGRSGTRPPRATGAAAARAANGITTGPVTAPSTGRRHQPWAEHVQLWLLGLPADLRFRRQWREQLGRRRGHAELGRPGPVRCQHRTVRSAGTKRKDCHHDAFPEESPGRLGSRRSRRLQQRRIGTPLTEPGSNGSYYGIIGPPGQSRR